MVEIILSHFWVLIKDFVIFRPNLIDIHAKFCWFMKISYQKPIINIILCTRGIYSSKAKPSGGWKDIDDMRG